MNKDCASDFKFSSPSWFLTNHRAVFYWKILADCPQESHLLNRLDPQQAEPLLQYARRQVTQRQP